MKYVKGRTNLSATIFVPYDCDNNCRFCTSKSEYKNCDSFSLEKIIRSIEKLNGNDLIQEYVITGGEPFANIEKLTTIIEAMEKPIYINTTLPSKTLEDTINLINRCDKICGINVSRHIGFEFKNVANINDIDRINKPIRINTVMNEKFTEELFLDFCNRYGKKKRDINLRADYRKITQDTLKSTDNVSKFLMDRFDYFSTESCLVCNSEHYSVNDEFICSYHRGIQFSSVTINEKCYVNDVLVKQDGSVYRDWDCVNDEEFLRWVLK